MTIEDCVVSGYHECIFARGQGVYTSAYGGSHYSQIAFFCGHGPECNGFETKSALDKVRLMLLEAVEPYSMIHRTYRICSIPSSPQAKANVDKFYAVVGVLEQMDLSLHMLEKYVPKYFKEARIVYK